MKFALIVIATVSLSAGSAPYLRSMVREHGLRFNSTASLPIGVYKNIRDGRLISFCPQEPYASLALQRGYRHLRNSEACPDGGEPLLKTIVAKAGDVVLLSPIRVSVNGKRLRNSAPMRLDSGGRTLPGYPFGTYVTRPGEVWVINEYNAKSFDSRYYGPIRVSDIREHLEPVLVLP